MKRALKALKMAASPCWQNELEYTPVSSRILAQALEISPSSRDPAAEGTTSLVALLEPREFQLFTQILNFPVPGSGELLSSIQQTESKSHFLPLRLWGAIGKPDLIVTAENATERSELA